MSRKESDQRLSVAEAFGRVFKGKRGNPLEPSCRLLQPLGRAGHPHEEDRRVDRWIFCLPPSIADFDEDGLWCFALNPVERSRISEKRMASCQPDSKVTGSPPWRASLNTLVYPRRVFLHESPIPGIALRAKKGSDGCASGVGTS